MEASVAHLWRPLGEILIEWQLLSHEQLDAALEVQRATGRRLGEVLIELEFVPRDILVTVLLEQCGLQEVELAETEQGFGSGLLSELRKRGSAHRPTPLQVVPTAEEPEPREERRRRWGRRKEDRARTAREARVNEAFASLETWAAELQREVAELQRLITEARG